MLTLLRSIRAQPRWLQILLLGQFVNAAGALAGLFLTLYLVTARGLGSGAAGLLTALLGAGLITGSFVGGAVGDRFGLRRTLIGSLLGWAATNLLIPIAPVVTLAPLLLVSGLIGGQVRPLISALVLRALPADERRTGAALWRVSFNAGAILGPPLGGLVAASHFGLVFAFDAISSALLAVFVLTQVPSDARLGVDRAAAAPGRLSHHLRADRLVVAVLIGAVLVDTSYRQLYVGLPLQLHAQGAPPWVYGLTVTLNAVLVVIGEVWISLRMARRSAAGVIVAGYLLVAASWLLFGAHPAVWSAMAMVVVISLGEMLYKPTATAAVADGAPPGFEGRYQSLYAGASITGTVIGPAVGGPLFGAHPGALWLSAAAAPLLAAAGLGAAARSQRRIPARATAAPELSTPEGP